MKFLKNLFRMGKPVELRVSQQTLTDEVFGEMEWEPDIGRWIAYPMIPDTEPPFYLETRIYTDSAGPVAPSSEVRQAWRRFLEREPEYRLATTQEMLAKGEGTWADPHIEAGEMAERLGWEFLTISGDGELSIYFTDDELYYGHLIIGTIRSDGVFDHAELYG
jgi:hypothetical protein